MKQICTSCGKKTADEGEEICQSCMELSLDTDTEESEDADDELDLGISDDEL
jgi:NMD protein affecting ribosome stability and mRNA decay